MRKHWWQWKVRYELRLFYPAQYMPDYVNGGEIKVMDEEDLLLDTYWSKFTAKNCLISAQNATHSQMVRGIKVYLKDVREDTA